jgi:GxxExxY protein
MKTNALLYAEETYAINRCIYDVYDSMPRFAEEALYQEALEIALADAGIPFESQKEIAPTFHEKRMAHTYRPDIICFDKIVVELKAVKQLVPAHFAQLRNYLGLLDMRVGLLVNFHAFPNVQIRRVYLQDGNSEGMVEDVETGEISPMQMH